MSKMRSARLAAAPTLVLLASAAAIAMPPFGTWSGPQNLEALPGSSNNVNTTSIDGCASHSRDGLTIVFNSNRGGNHDLYVATRPSISAGFGAPVPLPGPVNTSANEACATIATNGRALYFSSDRADSAYDLYVTRRGPKGWSAPVNLGPNINVQGMLDEAADIYEDEDGNEVMVFSRRPPSGPGGRIYQSVNGGPASPVQGGPYSTTSGVGDNRPSVTHDGLTIFWDSTRSGGLGGPDLYYATRASTSDPFGSAQHLAQLSSNAPDLRPYISWDGTFLTFASARMPGTEWSGTGPVFPDIWFATREKATGN